MLILRRRWEYWVCAVALHKIGAILIPGSLQLAKKDLIYRGNSAQIHTMVCLDDKYVLEQVDEAQPLSPASSTRSWWAAAHEGWREFPRGKWRSSPQSLHVPPETPAQRHTI